ncbi:conserved hypothetical protein [Hyphomicrobiales bacterium]|nr:conserved hypothetical protein [Hyphomicrobiales bacterium]CAH1701944.1 conserved hypothetical protein [Hyphomicrobiales bacterium]CAI0346101.1 conserved hypothetical protein [Hyphomicrobiales bacterium]
MTDNRYPPSPAGMASRLGQHLLLSLGIATVAGLVATVPGFLSGAAPARVSRTLAEPPAMSRLALLRDGKIVDRLDGSGGDDLTIRTRFAPAALTMPMSLGWPEGADWMPVRSAALAAPSSGAGEASARPTLRRVVSLPVRGVTAAGPLVVLPPAATTAIDAMPALAASRDDAWSRFVATPATKVADAVSGAAGSVQAAGSWGLSQAASLLPRW